VWRDGLQVDDTTAQAVTARTVLLLVDATSSQWPVTVAAAKLREAGAAAVLPLVIHKRP
jgi:ATP-dependent DNA helicase RecQ